MNIQVRDELRPADRASLEQILRSCKFFREDEIAVALELIDDRLQKGKASEYEFLIAFSGDRVVGYCCYGRIPCSVHSYDIYWIVVDPTIHRAGIGRKLVAAAEERIRKLGGKRVYVDTSSRPEYTPTHHFYSSCGYRVDATLRDFYAPGDNKVVFCKVLESSTS
jgi:ribosomal protein S18 acetylase RimI-like enzyme